ncbi:MAG: class I SAM-dependent methyltransferase [Bryobacteraceae bacterium]|jgi:SAM-dependent methyltransferase
MDDLKLLERMRADWNRRADEDANYYVAFGRRDQEDEEFFASAADVVRRLEGDLKRLGARDAALEIGCGPGRLMRPMSGHFAEIHGVDVSDEMVRLAGERLRGAPNAFAHVTSGADLAMFPDEKFDFVYSYAVFQHIPSRGVVFDYLREARRVLKTGGILRCQVNGLREETARYDTWSGVRIAPDAIARFALESDFQLLAMEQIWTQYMWITLRKRPEGWVSSLSGRRLEARSVIRNISNALTGDSVAPDSGHLAVLCLWMEGLPEECDVNHLEVSADGRACRPYYIGAPEYDGLSQVNAALPEGMRTGIAPVEARWLGQPLCAPSRVRIIPGGPAVPRLHSLTDGDNLLHGAHIVSGAIKVVMVEVRRPREFRARVDAVDAPIAEWFCADPSTERYEFNFRLPPGIEPGPHNVWISIGKREFAPVGIEVAPAPQR